MLVLGIESSCDETGLALYDTEQGLLAHALHYRDHVLPAMSKVRVAADALETVVSDELWPLPTYQEMLFIK